MSEGEEYEDVDLSLLLTSDSEIDREDRCFRKSVDFGKIDRDIMSECNKCGTENNLTKNRSVFCQKCGALLTNRHYDRSNKKNTAR